MSRPAEGSVKPDHVLYHRDVWFDHGISVKKALRVSGMSTGPGWLGPSLGAQSETE